MAWISSIQIKQRLAITDPNGTHEDESLFTTCANEACDWIEALGSRRFLSASYTRIFDGNGKTTIYLPVVPVTAVSSVIIGTSTQTIGTADDYRQGTVTIFWTDDRIVYPSKFTQGTANVKIAWTAGYALESIPHRYVGLACTVAILKWKERDRYGANQKQFRDQTTIYERELKGQDLATWRELRDWRALEIQQGYDV